MGRASPTRKDLTGQRFGYLVILGRSELRGKRGARTVPLWECRCDCGKITYKATDTLTNSGVSMCSDCQKQYAAKKMRAKSHYVDGTQPAKLKLGVVESSNSTGVRGVYFDPRVSRYRTRLRFQGKLMSFGHYSTLREAIAAREKAAEEYFGDYIDESKKKE